MLRLPDCSQNQFYFVELRGSPVVFVFLSHRVKCTINISGVRQTENLKCSLIIDKSYIIFGI